MPAKDSGPGPRYATGDIIPAHLEHLQLRLPLFERQLRRKQMRMNAYLTQAEAHEYVLNLYNEQALRLGTLVVIGIVGLSVLTLLTEGPVGMLIAVAKQAAWAAPLSAVLYFVGRYLVVPPPVADRPGKPQSRQSRSH